MVRSLHTPPHVTSRRPVTSASTHTRVEPRGNAAAAVPGEVRNNGGTAVGHFRNSLVRGISVALSAGCAGIFSGSASGGSGGASASASVSVKTGYFFGHNLRREKNIVYVLDLSGSMEGSSGSVVEQAGTDLAGSAVGGITGKFMGKLQSRGVDQCARQTVKSRVYRQVIAGSAGSFGHQGGVFVGQRVQQAALARIRHTRQHDAVFVLS